MTTEAVEKPKVHWSLWLVGVVALLWNSYGAYDYAMSHLQGDAYLRSAGMTEAQIAYYHAMPPWLTAAWAIGVWGGVLGAVLLFLRSKYALHAFVLSLAGLVASLAQTYLLDAPAAKAAGVQMPVFSAVLLGGCLFFVWYAAKVTKQGLVR